MLAQRITTRAPYDDPLAQAFASRNEAAFDRSSCIGWLFVLIGTVIACVVAGWLAAVIWLALCVGGWALCSALEDARRAGVVRG